MHFLSTVERLQLYRCSVHLVRCAAHPFAWLHADSLSVELTALQLGKRLLCRHCLVAAAPIDLRWLPPFGKHSEAMTKGQIERLVKIPQLQLRSLDCSAFRPPALAVWHLLLSDRAMQGLRVLILHDFSISAVAVDAEMVRLIAALPHSAHVVDRSARVFGGGVGTAGSRIHAHFAVHLH